MPRPKRSNFTSPIGCAVVLVPLQHAAAGHATPLDGADLDHRPVAEHHAARVDAEVAGAVEHLAGQFGHQRRMQRLGSDASSSRCLRGIPRPCPASIPLDQASTCSCEKPEGLADVTHGRTWPVGDHVGHLCRVRRP